MSEGCTLFNNMNISSPVFDKLEELLGSRYAAVNWIAELTDQIYDEYCGHLSKSEIMSWILEDKKPKNLATAKYRARYSGIDKFNSEIDYLNYVSDKDVVLSVRETLNESVLHKNLTYIYLGELQESQKSRIRVISNILWARIKEELS